MCYKAAILPIIVSLAAIRNFAEIFVDVRQH